MSGVWSMNRLKSMRCWPAEEAMSSKVTAGAVVVAVIGEGSAVEVVGVGAKRQVAVGEMKPSRLARSIAKRSSVRPM